MEGELKLVAEFAVILIAAGVFTVISKALKQPLILGYIVAGFIVGPHLGIFPQFSAESVKQWSELGIIFLLFSLGLEFSFKKLLKVGSSALITAGTQCAGMFVVGMIVGNALGWSMMESVFLGGMMSMSSTTIIIKAFDDLGLKKKPFASLVFGALVVEDLVAVLLLVLLSTLAVSNKFAGGEMLMGLAKLAFFLILWFLVGLYVIPTLLNKAKKYLSDEILLLCAIGLCFLMVVLANLAGFSSALGAFVMGSILAETMQGERIARLTSSIKDLFGAIFFVSVGMMLDPALIVQHWVPILVITVSAVGGILVFSTSGVLLAGKGVDTAIHSGFSLAQIGEFAFIIAGLGCSLGVVRDFIYPVIIAVSVITTFTTPYMIKAADPAIRFVRKRVPSGIIEKLDSAQVGDEKNSRAEQSEWRKLLKSYFLRLGLYGVMCFAILMASKLYLAPLSVRLLPSISESLRSVLLSVVTLLILSPFIYGMSITSGNVAKPAKKLMAEKASNKWLILSLLTFRLLVGVGVVLSVILEHTHLSWWALILLVVGLVFLFFSIRFSMHRISGLEGRFLSNLNAKEEEQKRATPVSNSVSTMFRGYDVHSETVEVSSDFSYAGLSLREMPFRKKSGVNIVKIKRGSRSILVPSGDELVFPGDKLVAVGTEDQLVAFNRIMKENSPVAQDGNDTEFSLEKAILREESYMTGKSLRELKLRSSGVVVISVMREGVLLTNPDADFCFRNGDLVWLSGQKDSVAWFMDRTV